MSAKENIVEKKFNKLTVIEDNGGDKVTVRCDCGTVKTVNKYNVVSGKVKSCGCIRRGKKRNDVLIDRTGERFGKLTVLKELHGGYVLCKCDCGNVKKINKGHMLAGDITSCGCNMSAEPVKKAVKENQVEGTNLLLIKYNKPGKRNTSGVRGVAWKAAKQKWEASICCQGKTHYLGYYDTLEQAAAARKAGEEKYYKPILEKYKNGENL